MPTDGSAPQFEFGVVEGRHVVAAFDGGMVTSDAGALLLVVRGRQKIPLPPVTADVSRVPLRAKCKGTNCRRRATRTGAGVVQGEGTCAQPAQDPGRCPGA